ncbi:hypothetical protein Syun_004042 [Stephania yunnanensis]|uniref:Uncharacterized protein n=1 Tax=Stephania yunnanensis TaxID=152371 RepID=A0AAP0L4U8_9MAGN
MADGSWMITMMEHGHHVCCGPKFDMKEIAPLLETLQKYWPSLSYSGSSTCHGGKGTFWAHELYESLAPRAADPNNDWHDYKLNHARCKVS